MTAATLDPAVEVLPPPADRLASLPTDRELPTDDGEPMETNWHRWQMNLLLEQIEVHWRDRKDFYAGGNEFLYFSNEHVFNKDFRGPDVYVVLGVDHERDRRCWVSWHEGGKLPDVIIELASESTIAIDRTPKWKLYSERFRTSEYYILDPSRYTVEGYVLTGGRPGPVQRGLSGRVVSPILGAEFGQWEGEFVGKRFRYFRLVDAAGNVLPIHRELAEARADAVTARFDALTRVNDALLERFEAMAEAVKQSAVRQDEALAIARAALDALTAEKARADAAEAELSRLRTPPPSE